MDFMSAVASFAYFAGGNSRTERIGLQFLAVQPWNPFHQAKTWCQMTSRRSQGHKHRFFLLLLLLLLLLLFLLLLLLLLLLYYLFVSLCLSFFSLAALQQRCEIAFTIIPFCLLLFSC
jgi:cellulose synthase/poly-beta-1,6-N-acetylglucosamine synthase-like glycosyltransferase